MPKAILILVAALAVLACGPPKLPTEEDMKEDLVGQTVSDDLFSLTFASYSEIERLEILEIKEQGAELAEIRADVKTPDNKGIAWDLELIATYRLSEGEWNLAALKLLSSASDSTRYREVLENVRKLGPALMSAMSDDPGFLEMQSPITGQALYDILSPYSDSFGTGEPPVDDPWGNPYEVWVNSSGDLFSKFDILLRSAGGDGEWETGPYRANTSIPAGDHDYDFVWVDGYLLTLPTAF